MITKSRAHLIIHMLLHCIILFIFLTVFFFAYLSKKEGSAVSNSMEHIINKEVPVILDEIDDVSKKIKIGDINWGKVDQEAVKLMNKPIDTTKVNKHNDKIKMTSIIIIISLLAIFIGFMIYFIYYKKYDINLRNILIDNMIVSLVVGVLEFLFFTMIALHYVPVTNTEATNFIVNSLERKAREV